MHELTVYMLDYVAGKSTSYQLPNQSLHEAHTFGESNRFDKGDVKLFACSIERR